MTSVSIGRRPSPIVLTDQATTKVADLLAQEGNAELALRVAVRPGGCSGFSYEMFFDSELESDDIVRNFGPVKVVVDPASAEQLNGATLDYKDGLQGAGFHITNPNATRTCGCGSSFS
ncbi:MAG TPA: iron-sulfur cluster insertion protein ErpA [Acidimicrobiales bacterium]